MIMIAYVNSIGEVQLFRKTLLPQTIYLELGALQYIKENFRVVSPGIVTERDVVMVVEM